MPTNHIIIPKIPPHMYTPKILIALFLSFIVLTSCEKLEIPTTDNKSGNDETPEGTVYTVDDILAHTYAEKDNIYVEGYIVGYIDGTHINQAIFCTGDIETNILLAATPDEEEPTCCIPIQLTTSPNTCRQTREAVNLTDHPDMLHQRIRIQGNIATYMGTKGILQAHNHTLLPPEDTPKNPENPNNPENPENPESPENPETPSTPSTPTLQDTLTYVQTHGYTPETAFTVHDFKTYIPTFLLNTYLIDPELHATGIPEVIVHGYIVGYIKGSSLVKTIFSAQNAVETNIVIADSPDEIDPDQCIAVQLTTTSTNAQKTRNALNLKSHPENLHQEIIILGDIAIYMGANTYGLKNARNYGFAE